MNIEIAGIPMITSGEMTLGEAFGIAGITLIIVSLVWAWVLVGRNLSDMSLGITCLLEDRVSFFERHDLSGLVFGLVVATYVIISLTVVIWGIGNIAWGPFGETR